MFNDFLPVNPTWLNCSFCMILYLLMAMMAMKFTSPYFNRRINIIIGWLLIFAFFMFSFYGYDWFAYFDHIKSARYIIGDINQLTNREALESVYYLIAYTLNSDYLLWRFVVFGLTVFLSYLMAKRLGLNQAAFFYAFALIATPILSYARVSLAMAIAFYGLSFLSYPMPSKRPLSYLLGSFLVIISVFFHKSALVLPFITYIAYSFRITKVKMILITVFIISAFILLNTTDIIYMIIGNDEMQFFISGKSTKYLTAETHYEGIGQRIIKTLFWVSFYLFACFSIVVLWKKQLTNKIIIPFFNLVVLIILFASIFLFISGANTYMLFYRFVNYASIPISVVVAYCINENIYRKAFVRISYVCILSNFLGILYSTYSSYLLYD